MGKQVRILAISGSMRKASFNSKILRIAANAAQAAGADVTFLDLRELNLPLYDGDFHEQEGVPEAALKAKKLFESHDGLLIASPEHNGTISAVLKNLIDWVSVRVQNDEPMLHSFRGKVAAIMSTSPGALGGLRGLFQLRDLLQNVMIMVMPSMHAIGGSHAAIGPQGAMVDVKEQEKLEALGAELAQLLSRINP